MSNNSFKPTPLRGAAYLGRYAALIEMEIENEQTN